MLRKLYKHEFISLYRTLLPLYGVLLGLSAFTRILSVMTDDTNGILEFWKTMLTSVSMIIMIGIFIVGFVVVIVRFYQNLLSKQGYLTNTLPFKMHSHIICKLVCGVTVELSGVAVAIVSLIIMLGTKAGLKKICSVLAEMFGSFSELTGKANAYAVVIEIILIFLLSLAANLLMFYACMAIGQQFKNKILASVIAYFCIYAAIQFIGTVVLTVGTFVFKGNIDLSSFDNLTVATVSQGFMIFLLLLVVIQGAVYYLITNYFLAKKLNLE